jgi:membrane dipeptidase
MHRSSISRRSIVAGGLALPFAGPSARAQQPTPTIPIADMHFHLRRSAAGEVEGTPLGAALAEGGATLVAVTFSSDGPWIERRERGIFQKSVPEPGASFKRVQRLLSANRTLVAAQRLKLVTGPSDVDLALAGTPHVVLAIEGADFIEQEPARVTRARDLGLRHLQLVHYIRNSLGDFQTVEPEHKGLSPVGKAVVRECNRHGILVDLAHCTPAAVADALAVSKVPMVWSHSSLARPEAKPPHWSMVGWKARQLTLADARSIARAGGVIGLWALATDIGKSVDRYAQRLNELAEAIGEDHVAFGTDLNGLGPFAMMSTYADVRLAVDALRRLRVPEKRIRKIAIENYARVLKTALQPT